MLMRTDPFRELDRLTQRVLGNGASTAVMPMDAYRHGESFVVHFDLPGVDASSIDLTVEKNVLTVSAQRQWQPPRATRCWPRSAPRAPSPASCSWARASTPSASRRAMTTAC